MRDFFIKHKLDIILLFLLSLTLPVFFYKLGDSSLVSFDEAWYADIARNIAKTGTLFELTWNGNPYQDHPPAGFWLIAVVFKLFGINEFWARFAPTAAGFLSVIVTYFLGRELFNRYVGVVSAVALTSATWFLFRARSGNLDTILTIFFLLSVFLAVKATGDKRYLIPFSLSLMILFLTKSLVPFTIIPALVIIFYKAPIFKKLKLKDLILPTAIFLAPIMAWFITQTIKEVSFIQHYLKIGFPGRNIDVPFSEAASLYKQYFHNGIGKWFWPGILGMAGGLLTFRSKSFLILFVFIVTFSLPFLFSREGHIWHLIPLYPFMILACFGFGYAFVEKITKQKFLAILAIFTFGFYFWFIQIKQNWYQFIDIPRYISDEQILSQEASKYPHSLLYIDGDFYPTAVFYSQKEVQQISRDMLKALLSKEESMLLITHQWLLNSEQIPPEDYEIIKQDRDKILILKK